MFINRNDVVYILLSVLAIIAISLLSYFLIDGNVLSTIILAISLSTTLVLTVVFTLYRRTIYYLKNAIRENLETEYRQIESLFALYSIVKPNKHLPDMRNWAASPDMLKKIYEITLANKPNLVLEASSGLSTVILAYAIKRNGSGRLISLEHDKAYAEITRSMLADHDLESVATVYDAPLVKVRKKFKGDDLWYDVFQLKQI